MRGTARISDRRNFVFHKRVIVQGQPPSESRKTPVEIKRGAPVSGIDAAAKGVAGGEERVLHRTHCDGKIRAAKNAGAANAKLKIGRGLEVDLEAVDHRLLREGASQGKYFPNDWILRVDPMRPRHLPDPELRAQRSKKSQKARQFLRMRLIDQKHVHRFRIIAPQEWVLGWARPECLFAKGGLPA